jgi:hypothetical protein
MHTILKNTSRYVIHTIDSMQLHLWPVQAD